MSRTIFRTALASLAVTTSLLTGTIALSAPASAASAPTVAAASAGTLTPTRTAAPKVAATQAYSFEVLRIVNAQRAAHGLRPLKLDLCAYRYAVTQNARIARSGSLSHQALVPVMNGCGARGAGENVAYGNVSAASMMSMWMNSPGHRANILRSSFTHIAISAIRMPSGRWYGTQVFLTR